ncbi:MAG TPA: GAF domain-containing sensor histidine kinase [Anaerolineales bacterium]|jgi:signal transduction histidine kinase
MGANYFPSFYDYLHALVFLVYCVIIFLSARRFRNLSSPALWLVGYASLAFALYLYQLGAKAGYVTGQNLDGSLLLEKQASLLMGLLLYQTLQLFLGKDFKPVLFLGGVALYLALLAINNQAVIFLASMAVSALTLVTLGIALTQTRQHLHRNRLLYWIPVLAFSIMNDLSLYYQQGTYAIDMRFVSTLVLAYIILRHHIPDVRDFFRQTSIYLITAVVSVALYIGGVGLLDNILSPIAGYESIWTGAGLALFIALLFVPLSNFVRKLINWVFRFQSYDPSLALRSYSASISNILDLDKLAEVAIGTIVQLLEIEKGFLFLVDTELDENDQKVYHLTEARREGTLPEPGGVLSAESPIVQSLLKEQAPLLQYDIDFAPDFMNAPLAERKWLSGLVLDVYVPVFAKGEWIGLLAFGPKPSSRYTDDDLNMLATLASQTGVGLENARLVENLKRLNIQVREAYTFLDKANHDLAKLESTKSNFISIASHELRTPLTVSRGYIEMLLEDEALPIAQRELVRGVHKSLLRQHEIMDSMFDIAKLDTRSAELQSQDVSLPEIIRTVVMDLAKAAGERSQEIMLDLPSMRAIKADPEAMRKLFHHLVINAIKFTPNHGTISVTGAMLPPNNRDLPEGGVEIVINDTGVGVDPDFQEIIFTKFYQPEESLNRHSTGKTKFKGSGAGLGLALSRAIVEAHGGRIWVESQGFDEEKLPGSAFHVVLPLRLQGESATTPMTSAVKMKLV